MSTRIYLKTIRERRGMSAADLATLVGVARQTIYAIESGSFVPNTAVALQLARALDATVEELFELEVANEKKAKTVEADLLDESEAVPQRQPVRLCRVGKRFIASPSTITSAWLPEADGLVVKVDKRVGRLGASTSKRVRVECLGSDEINRLLVAGCDPAISFLARQVAASTGVELETVECSSERALEWLRQGKVHLAGAHLRDPKTGEFNLPFIRKQFPRGGFRVVTFASWEQGLIVPPGNPQGIRSIADLARPRITVINREKGAGSRELLDRLLREAGIMPVNVRGYKTVANGHLAAARAVREGEVSCCVANRAAARAMGLEFIPLAVERYDLVTLGRFISEPATGTMLAAAFEALSHLRLRRELELLAGYDTSQTGRVVA